MIISGIAATAHADLQGHVLLAGAVNFAQRVPLRFEHGREIGEVTNLMYAGHDLYIVAETDDAEALKLDYFSVAGKPILKEQRGNLFHVSRFKLSEVSVVRLPANDRCRVLDRKASDPMREYIRARGREIDLTIQRVQCLSKYLQLAGRL